MRAPALGSILCVLALSTACSQAPTPEPPAAAPAAAAVAAPVSTATTRQVMLGLVIPAADVVWGAATTAPTDDAAWEKIEASAAMIAEAGNLMMTGVRVVDQADWLAYAKAMADAATTAAKAAHDKNLEQLSDAGNVLYDTCDTCHKKYMAARQGE